MKNRYSFYLRYVLSLFVFLFLLSFLIDKGYGQEFPDRSGLKPKLGERLKLTKETYQRIREAIKVQKMNSAWLMDNDDIVGTATGIGPDGEPEIRVFAAKAGIRGIPGSLDGFPVKAKVTGRFYALGCPDGPTGPCDRPVPIGVSTGHPAITAGTIGARVTRDLNGDGVPEGVYALSNNHVYAAINTANIGDNVIQPGAYDGGTDPADKIGTLADFEAIRFCDIFWIWLICSETNTIDAAIADVMDPSTGVPLVEPFTLSDGYGSPNSVIHPAFGVPDVSNDVDENLTQLLGESVQKYGRATGLTYGTVDSINATVDVCYDDLCYQVARFVDQIIITPGTFSGGGDSGSLIVTNDENRHPVGLLFAGSTANTVANRIDRVLMAFNVDIDSGAAPNLDSITVDPSDATVEEGQTQQFTATGHYDDQSTADITQTAIWDSTNSDVASVDSGLATGLSAGTTEITAAQDGKTSNAATLEVTAAPVPTLEFIVVAPASDSVEQGHTKQFTATGHYNDESTADITQTAAWHSSNTIVATIDSSGLATGLSAGTTEITATQDGKTSNEAKLQVTTAPLLTLDSITVDPASATVEEGHTQQFTATGTYNDSSTADLTTTATWESSDTAFATIDSAGLATGLSAGTVQITATQDSVPSGPATLQVTATTYAGPYLRTGKVCANSDTWTKVNLDHAYGEMVVVCTPSYDRDLLYGTTMPVVAQVRNTHFGDSFEVKLMQAVGGSLERSEAWVYWVVVEAGVYDLAGVKMEADTFVSTVTDNYRSWVGQSRTYQQSYTDPVVLGQVMTYYSELWTAFWCRGSSRSNPPSTDYLYVGKHQGEDRWFTRANERVGYIVIEAGNGEIEGTLYEARLGADTIRGMGDSPPYDYPLNGLSFAPSTAIVTQAGMDGGNGGWAVIYGDDPLPPSWMDLAIDEDWVRDAESSHTSEQVGYIVFEEQQFPITIEGESCQYVQ
jgi:uncharacterized protein YjdB